MAHPPLHLIGCAGSSGSTLLASLLHGTSGIVCGPESSTFVHRRLFTENNFSAEFYRCVRGKASTIVYNRLKGLSFALVPSAFFCYREFYGYRDIYSEYSLLKQADTVVEFVKRIRESMQQIHSLPQDFIWVEKTPRNAYVSREFLEAFPGCTYIHMIRDGRDVMLSLAKRFMKELNITDGNVARIMALIRWCHDIKAAARGRGMPGYIEVRYEDLVENPLEEINKILEQTGAATITEKDLVPKQLPKMYDDHATWSYSPAQGIQKGSAGKWRHMLSEEEKKKIAAFEIPSLFGGTYRVSDILEEFGYTS